MAARLTGLKPGEALQIRYDMVGNDPEYDRRLEQARMDSDVAQIVYDIREAAGLTQKELAQRVGTTQSVIARLEDADYHGHTLRMLRRIGSALGYEVEVRFRPVNQPAAKAKPAAASKVRKPVRRKPAAVSPPVARKPAGRSAKSR